MQLLQKLEMMFSSKKPPDPQITLVETLDFYMSPVSPAPKIYAEIHDAQGSMVGRMTYAVSPIADMLYVYEIKICTGRHRKGYGTAALCEIQRRNPFPITAVGEIESAYEFWGKLRTRLRKGPGIATSLSIYELEQEQLRWPHLSELSAQVQRSVANRLIAGVSWKDAVGCGLEEGEI